MADVPVKFNIESYGVPKVKADLRSITDLNRDQKSAIQRLHQNSAQRMKEIDRDYANSVRRLSEQTFRNEEEKMRRLTELHRQHEEKKTRLMEREALKQKQISDTQVQNTKMSLAAMGQFMGAGGMYGAGHVMRGFSAMGIGAELGVGAIAGIAAAGVALGGVVVAAKLVESAFEQTAGAFLSAVGTIGRARGLQNMLTETAENERLGKITRMTVSPDERMTDEQLTRVANKMAANPEFGGHTSGAWRQAFGRLGTETGLQKSILNNTGLLTQLGQMGHLGGVNPTDILGAYSGIYNQNRNLSQEQILSTMRSGIGIGREGQFNIGEFATGGSRLMSLPGTYLGGDYQKNIQSVLTYGALTKGKTPGHSLEESGVEASAFFREISAPAHRAAALQLGAKFNKQGLITNPDELVARAAANKPLAESLIPALGGREAGPFLGHIRTGTPGITDTSTVAQAEKAILENIRHYEQLSISQAQLESENQDALTVQDKLQAAFNRLADELEGPLLKSLADIVPHVDAFVKILLDNKDPMIKTFNDIITISEQLGLGFASLMISVAGLLNNPIMKAGLGLAMAPAVAERSMLENKLASERMERDTLATVLETGVYQSGAAKGRPMLPEDMERAQKQYQTILADIPETVKKINIDTAVIDSMAKLPDAMSTATDTMSRIIYDLRVSLDANTAANAAKTPAGPPTPDKNGN